jgi:hypothetical protein
LLVTASARALRTTLPHLLMALGLSAFRIGIALLANAAKRVQLDPLAQVADGYRDCEETAPPLLTIEQFRIVAHEWSRIR